MNEQQHERDIVVWDVPSAIDCGAAFSIHVGMKCHCGCPPSDWRVEIRDQDGAAIAAATVGDQLWPETAALYYCRIELAAPEEAGLFAWEIVGAGQTPEVPAAPAHPACHTALMVRTVPAGDCRLTVIAVDRVSQEPVPGLRVVIHPYRAWTDDSGAAEFRLPRGQYRLFVSGKDFFPFRSDGTLNGDTTIRAELEIDCGPTDAELWS